MTVFKISVQFLSLKKFGGVSFQGFVAKYRGTMWIWSEYFWAKYRAEQSESDPTILEQSTEEQSDSDPMEQSTEE